MKFYYFNFKKINSNFIILIFSKIFWNNRPTIGLNATNSRSFFWYLDSKIPIFTPCISVWISYNKIFYASWFIYIESNNIYSMINIITTLGIINYTVTIKSKIWWVSINCIWSYPEKDKSFHMVSTLFVEINFKNLVHTNETKIFILFTFVFIIEKIRF